MATNTYRAQLNYHDSRWGWGNEGTASQGAWDGTGTRTGVLYFPGLASLKNKIVNRVKLPSQPGRPAGVSQQPRPSASTARRIRAASRRRSVQTTEPARRSAA